METPNRITATHFCSIPERNTTDRHSKDLKVMFEFFLHNFICCRLRNLPLNKSRRNLRGSVAWFDLFQTDKNGVDRVKVKRGRH